MDIVIGRRRVILRIGFLFNEDLNYYGYNYNNIIDNGRDSWQHSEIALGSNGGYDHDFSNNWNNLFFSNNYVYRPQDDDVISNEEFNVVSYYSKDEFMTRYPEYLLYESDYDSLDLLYSGISGADGYIARGDHEIESGVTVSDGGVGGMHPYLDGVVLPSYVGAVNPDDSDWVEGVLGLADVSYLRDSSGDPDWVEGTVIVLVEDCGNGEDDDGDGVVDCDDVDCVGDLACGVVCVHEADNDPCDGVVSTEELVVYLELWLLGGIDIEEAVEVIGLWRG